MNIDSAYLDQTRKPTPRTSRVGGPAESYNNI